MRSVLLVALAVALTAAACNDGRTTVAPTPTPRPFETTVSSPPLETPTIPPFPTILPPVKTSGWIVYRRGADLWVAKLDGSAAAPLVQDALGSQFAGLSVEGAGQRVVYFTALTEVVGAEPSIEGGTLEVRRRALDGTGPIENVTSFRLSDKQVREFRLRESDVSVSPDGQHLVYADETGLWLHDLVTGFATRLLTNSGCEHQSIGLCSTYRSPSWSPAGDWLVLTRILYEGAVADFIRPLEPVTEYTTDIGALWRRWSSDGAQICGPEGRLQSEGFAITTPRETFARDLDEDLDRAGIRPTDRPITSCAWADDGSVALEYFHDERGSDQRIAVLAADGTLVAEVDSPLNQSALVGWLPDQSGFIAVYGDGEGRRRSFIVQLDGSIHALAVETDDVIAIFPD